MSRSPSRREVEAIDQAGAGLNEVEQPALAGVDIAHRRLASAFARTGFVPRRGGQESRRPRRLLRLDRAT